MLNIKKLFAVVLLVAIVVTTMPISLISAASTNGVFLSIKAPSAWTVTEGESVSFTLNYATNPGHTLSIDLRPGAIGMYGFTGDVSISGEGNTRVVTVSNISLVGEAGYGKYLTVNAGTGFDEELYLSNGVKSAMFTINAKAAPVPADTVAPVLTISDPNPSVVTEGGSVSYTLTYSDNVGIAGIDLRAGAIGLYGFTGDIAISGEGNTRVVTVNNVKNVGTGKYITVNSGTGYDAELNLCNGVKGNSFEIVAAKAKDTVPPVLTISDPNPAKVTEGGSVSFTLTYTDDVAVAGIDLRAGAIGLYGFTGDISISGEGNRTRVITVSNVKNVGTGKYITVKAGPGYDAELNLCNGVKSNPFEIVAAKAKDSVPPVLTIAGPDKAEVYEGETVVYTLTYTDDVAVAGIDLRKGAIGLYGFTADVEISGEGNTTRTITLKNVKNIGDGKYITVNAGTGYDAELNLCNGVKSNPFKIVAKEEPKNDDPTPVDPTPTDPTPVDPTPVNPTPEKPSDWRPNPNTGRI